MSHSKHIMAKIIIADNFIHRQTTANQMRFTTLSLSDTETKIINANAKALEIEKQIFTELSALIIQNFEKISAAAEALAVIDITNSLATLARDEEWCRPKIDSSLLIFTPKNNFYPIKNAKNLEKVTRIFFKHRRKMLKKPFNQLFDGDKKIFE